METTVSANTLVIRKSEGSNEQIKLDYVAVKNAAMTPNSSLAQIADYSALNYLIQGGEVTGGFFTSSTASIDLASVRDIGNAVLGGGTNYSNNQVYPDGPDTITIVVTNVGTAPQSVLGRISWTEAQA